MSTVTVLTPNGRRQNVKVTPNTTLLQVLEEVCKKHELKSEEYDIKHHNKVLDVTTIFRFSGLPNNAQLELAEVRKQRFESPVTLGLHLESGDRCTGEFVPSDSLWSVIKTLKPDEANPDSNPVVIYMRKEIFGKEDLEKTTLRSLGLTSGRAMLRFLHKKPEEMKIQAHVSSPLTHTPVASQPVATAAEPPIQSLPNEQPPIPESKPKEFHSDSAKTGVSNDEKPVSKPIIPEAGVSNVEKQPKTKLGPKNQESSKMKSPAEVKKSVAVSETKGKSKTETKAVMLGERNALAFDLNVVQPLDLEDLPDEFYELTVDDVKMLFREAKRQREDLDDAPLVTAAQRELEESKKVLRLLTEYKTAVIRVKFPDRTVLQGTFSAKETIAAVKTFVAKYLSRPDVSFYLYMTPPKNVLGPELRLIEANCVPNAVLYFGLDPGVPKREPYLRTDLFQEFSSYSAAEISAAQFRSPLGARERSDAPDCETATGPTTPMEVTSVASTSQQSDTSAASVDRRRTRSPPVKVPKWFKPSK